jgi:hypothetical protein
LANIQYAKQHNFNATLSIKGTEVDQYTFWDILASGTIPNSWRSAINNDQVIGSFHVSIDSKGTTNRHRVLSTGFNAIQIPLATPGTVHLDNPEGKVIAIKSDIINIIRNYAILQ